MRKACVLTNLQLSLLKNRKMKYTPIRLILVYYIEVINEGKIRLRFKVF